MLYRGFKFEDILKIEMRGRKNKILIAVSGFKGVKIYFEFLQRFAEQDECEFKTTGFNVDGEFFGDLNQWFFILWKVFKAYRHF